jgi:DNA primase
LPSAGNKQNASERQILLDAHSAACLFFEKLLSHPQQGLAAREYLAERGFNAESIQRFQIGLAPDAWDGLLKHPGMKKFTPPQLALAGLVKPRDRDGARGEGYYDTFRNRLMFPIRDENGRVIAFGGRVMPGSTDEAAAGAKYLNSPETPLFSKSRSLFGLDLARQRIVETRTVAVVEGYTDVAMAHQFGVANVVSVLGTALTEQHVGILRRFADRIVLLFDPDSAGDAAVNRAVELFLSQPVEVTIAALPDGMDPDEFLLKHGAEAFNKILADSADALTFKWKQLTRQFRSSDAITGQQQAVQEYLQTLSAARNSGGGAIDSLRWGAALSRVSRLTDIPVQELNRRFGIGRSGKRGPGKPAAQVAATDQPTTNAPVPPLQARQRAEGFILGLLLIEPQRWDDVQQHIGPTDFTDEGIRSIAEIFWRHQQDEGPPVFNEFLGLLDETMKSAAVALADGASDAEDAAVFLAGSMQHLLDDHRREEGRKLIAHLRKTSDSSPAGVEDDMETIRRLQENARQPDLKRSGL